MTSPPLITANITKNASNVPISLQFYKMFPIQQVFLLKNEKGAVETTAPPGDSGGIQTHDLQLSYGTIAILQLQIYANCFKPTNDCCTKNVKSKRFHKKI